MRGPVLTEGPNEGLLAETRQGTVSPGCDSDALLPKVVQWYFWGREA